MAYNRRKSCGFPVPHLLKSQQRFEVLSFSQRSVNVKFHVLIFSTLSRFMYKWCQISIFMLLGVFMLVCLELPDYPAGFWIYWVGRKNSFWVLHSGWCEGSRGRTFLGLFMDSSFFVVSAPPLWPMLDKMHENFSNLISLAVYSLEWSEMKRARQQHQALCLLLQLPP